MPGITSHFLLAVVPEAENVAAARADTEEVAVATVATTGEIVEVGVEALEAGGPLLLTTEADPGAIIDHALGPILLVSRITITKFGGSFCGFLPSSGAFVISGRAWSTPDAPPLLLIWFPGK